MQDNQMHYSDLDPYALSDLQRVADALTAAGEPPVQLLNALAGRSPILPRIALNTLRDAALVVPRLSGYDKRVVTWLTEYLHGQLSGEGGTYARARQAEAVREANSISGRTSTRERVSLPDDLVAWWSGLTPQERGEIVLRGRHAD